MEMKNFTEGTDLYNQEHWDYGLIKGLAVAASMV